MLLLTIFLIIESCNLKTGGIGSTSSMEQWKLANSNCNAKHDEGSAALCKWILDIYSFELSPFKVIPFDSGSYDYSCPDINCVINSQQRYTGFFIRTRGNFDQGPPEMLFPETTLSLSGSSNILNVITVPNVSVCGHPLEEPWYSVGLIGFTAFLFFPKVPEMENKIVLELPYKDASKNMVFSLTFKRF